MKFKSLSRKLRRQATDVEHLLWNYLRARQLAGFKFRRQVVIEPYIVDFACFDAKLIIEADGGQHLEQNESDAKRTVYLESLGYRVIRFWNHEILEHTDVVLEQIQRALINIPSPQHSRIPSGFIEHYFVLLRSPSPEGRGGQASSNIPSSQPLSCSPSVPEGRGGQGKIPGSDPGSNSKSCESATRAKRGSVEYLSGVRPREQLEELRVCSDPFERLGRRGQ